jgi:ATP:ADP antiporter, AAA family
MKLVNQVLNLRPGDLRRGLPLFAYYFFIITFYMMGRVARDAIFLDRFTAVQLPYADMSVAAISGVLVALYIRAGRRANLRNLQVGSLLCFAASLPLMWWGQHVEKLGWIPPLFYIWVGVCGILAVSQVWTLANFVWTTREAKRLFGMLGSGGIVGGIAGGFLAKWTASRLGTDAMLLLMAATLVLCAGLVVVIWRQRHATQGDGREVPGAHARPQSLFESFRLVRQSPHLRAIAALILLGSVVTTVAGWQLKAIAKQTLVQKDVLAAFLGAFAGYAGIASLAAQLLLTTKLLRRFGVGVALLLLPLFLTAGSIAVAISGSLLAVTILKGSDAVFRYSVDTSAMQLLYLPVPSGIKVQVKSFIDTVVWKIGDGLSGLTLLIFATYLQFTPQQISWIALVLLGVWIAAAVYARHQYVATLRDNIQSAGIRPAEVTLPTMDQATTNVFAEKLTSANAKDVLYALTLFQMGQQLQSHGAVRKLLTHPSPDVRAKAMEILGESGDLTVRDQVTALLGDEDLDVRTEALRYLTRHDHVDPLARIEQLGDFAGSAIRSATVAFLGRPGENQNIDAAGMILDGMIAEPGAEGRETRLEAARVLAMLPEAFEARLEPLLEDPDPEVRREAVRTAASLQKRRFVPALIRNLAQPKVRAEAADALVGFENSVVGTLHDHLIDASEAIEIRRAIPAVLLRIGTLAAAAALTDALIEPDLEQRFRVISALNKLQETNRELVFDRQMIDTAMIAELTGHYRSYQILGTRGGVPDEPLQAAMQGEVERIFRLMKLLFPALELKEAYTAMLSADAIMHANALEFLDNTLSSQLRTLLVPLLDSEVTVAERIRLADRFLGFSDTGTGTGQA